MAAEKLKNLAINKPVCWDAAAKDYDAHFGGPNSFTRFFCKDGVELLHWDQDAKEVRVLDIAAGTGAFALEASNKLRSLKIENGHILATDFSPKMVEILETHAKELGRTEIECEVMDGQSLTLDDNSFDIVASFFGLMFFPERAKALQEVKRVLKPNGQCLIASWKTPPPIKIFKQFNQRWPSPDSAPPFRPPLSTIEELESELKQAGFTNVSVKVSAHSYKTSADDFVASFASNPAAQMFKARLPAESDFRTELKKVTLEVFPTGECELFAEGLLGLGTKP